MMSNTRRASHNIGVRAACVVQEQVARRGLSRKDKYRLSICTKARSTTCQTDRPVPEGIDAG